MFQFYLAFENSLCEDYITEKFWKVLNFNVIPVVLNGVNMSAVAPPHSYIDIKQFENIAGDIYHLNRFEETFMRRYFITEAAKYLIKVSEDEELFASYFWWRSFYTSWIHHWRHTKQGNKVQSIILFLVDNVSYCSVEAWCSLCASLHDPASPVSVISDFHRWWVEEARCACANRTGNTSTNVRTNSGYFFLLICLNTIRLNISRVFPI